MRSVNGVQSKVHRLRQQHTPMAIVIWSCCACSLNHIPSEHMTKCQRNSWPHLLSKTMPKFHPFLSAAVHAPAAMSLRTYFSTVKGGEKGQKPQLVINIPWTSYLSLLISLYLFCYFFRNLHGGALAPSAPPPLSTPLLYWAACTRLDCIHIYVHTYIVCMHVT